MYVFTQLCSTCGMLDKSIFYCCQPGLKSEFSLYIYIYIYIVNGVKRAGHKSWRILQDWWICWSWRHLKWIAAAKARTTKQGMLKEPIFIQQEIRRKVFAGKCLFMSKGTTTLYFLMTEKSRWYLNTLLVQLCGQVVCGKPKGKMH